MSKAERKLFYIPQFLFDQLMEIGFIFPYPFRQLLLHYRPAVILTHHPENDPVTTIIAYIDAELGLFIRTGHSSKVELALPALGFQQAGKMYISSVSYLHNLKSIVETTICMLQIDKALLIYE